MTLPVGISHLKMRITQWCIWGNVITFENVMSGVKTNFVKKIATFCKWKPSMFLFKWSLFILILFARIFRCHLKSGLVNIINSCLTDSITEFIFKKFKFA